MGYHEIAPAEFEAFSRTHEPLVLDMRDPVSFDSAHIDGARRVTDELIAELRRSRAFGKTLLIYCYHGISSHDLASLFVALGFTSVFHLAGGWQAWAAFDADRQPVVVSYELQGWLADNGFEQSSPLARSERGMTPLMLASLQGNMAIVSELVACGAGLHLVNDDGNTALWFACTGEHTEMIRLLIDSGLDPDHQNPDGASCLIYAASAGKLEVVQTLLEAGADPDLATLDGFTALDCAATLPVLRLLRRPKAAA